MNELRTQINRLKQEGDIILTGYFNAKINIDQPNCKQPTSRNDKYLEELIKETGLIPISAKATRGRWTRQHRTNPTEKIDNRLHPGRRKYKQTNRGNNSWWRRNTQNKGTKNHTTNHTRANRETQNTYKLEKPTKESWDIFNKIIDSNINNIKDYQSLHQNIIHAIEEAFGKPKTITLTKKRKESDETKRLRKEKKEEKKLQIEIKKHQS